MPRAKKLAVVHKSEIIGYVNVKYPKRPKNQPKDEWDPILEDWEKAADEALNRQGLPDARAFTYVESYLEGDEGSAKFREKLAESGAEFIAWI